MERKNYAVITVTVIVIALVSLDIYYWSSEPTRIYADKVLAWTFLLITAGILLILELAGALFRNIKVAFPSGGKKASRLYIAHATSLIVAIAGWLIIYFMMMSFSSHGT